MIISKSEVIAVSSHAIRTTAERLGVRDAAWKAADELLEAIKTKDGQTHKVLTAFVCAYEDWFAFHLWIEENAKGGKLNSQEGKMLADKIRVRDTTRNAILKRLKQMGQK